jgi:hypothetical protein
MDALRLGYTHVEPSIEGGGRPGIYAKHLHGKSQTDAIVCRYLNEYASGNSQRKK